MNNESASLRLISGVGVKAPACFLVEAGGKRLAEIVNRIESPRGIMLAASADGTSGKSGACSPDGRIRPNRRSCSLATSIRTRLQIGWL